MASLFRDEILALGEGSRVKDTGEIWMRVARRYRLIEKIYRNMRVFFKPSARALGFFGARRIAFYH
ncbi:MAG: hypothetical protein OEZ52_08130 [Candidatus Aminicenantes bacterium]|nr:hypothetical protein [Candidatus Aminicenantes bacterium]